MKVLKIICFVVFLCFKTYLFQDVFMTKKGSRYFCVTNSSSALTAISNESDVTYYVPRTNSSTRVSKIEKDYLSATLYGRPPWYLVNDTLNGIIFDERWEGFQLERTKFVPTGEFEYKSFFEISHANVSKFEIPFSIRIEDEAHVFLCDGIPPSKSNCYWFMLDAFRGEATAVRKCSTNKVPENTSDSYTCEIEKFRKNNTAEDPGILSSKKWSHILLSKTQNNFVVHSVNSPSSNRTIIDWTDPEDLINTTHVFIQSRNRTTQGRWKLHKLSYIQTNDESKDVNLGKVFTSENGFVCISMYIKMCTLCTIKLELRSNDTGTSLITNTYRNGSTWKQIKITADNLNSSEKVLLFVSTIGSTDDKFWIIDHVRQCQKLEYRVVKLTEEAPCQLMSDGDNLIEVNDNATISTSVCPELAIGPFCFPCRLIYEDCKQVTIYYNIYNKHFRQCSAGFEKQNCQFSCNKNTYGHGCAKNCGNCKKTCNNINGYCELEQCLENYSGKRCNIPPPISFISSPIVFNISYVDALVTMKNLSVQNLEINPKFKALHYHFEYKQKNESSTWRSFGENISIDTSQNISLRNLQPETNYVVRAIIIPSNISAMDYSPSYVKETSFKTLCKDLTQKDITYSPKNTSVDITIKPPQYSCKLSGYQAWSGNNSEHHCYQKETLANVNPQLKLTLLEPFTSYYFCLTNAGTNLTFPLQTSEGIPDQVRGLKVLNVTSTSVNITWEHPSALRGNFSHYVLKWSRISSLACNIEQQSTNYGSRDINVTLTQIKNLVPFSKYQLNVSAANNKLTGPEKTIPIETLFSNHITKEERPTITFIENANYTTINLSLAQCQNRQGPISLNVSYYCTDVWCEQNKTLAYFDTTKNLNILLKPLIPFSHYKVRFEFCRNKSSCDKTSSVSETINTKEAAPPKVTGLDFYSKTENSVSLRWQPPYPPHGELSGYNIKFFRQFDSSQIESNYSRTPESCLLWPDYHCATINNNIRKRTNYTVTVQAQNKLTKLYGEKEKIEVFTGIERPGGPENLQIGWYNNNDLNITWKHPNRSNGNIHTFNVKILPSSRNVKTTKNIQNFTLDLNGTVKQSYSMKVSNSTIMPSTLYTIIVTANNSLDGEKAVINDTSRPEIPILLKTAYSSTNFTISIEYNFQELTAGSDSYNLELFSMNNKNTVDSIFLLYSCSINQTEALFIILGNNTQNEKCNYSGIEFNLTPGTDYDFKINLTNTFGNKTSRNTYHEKYSTAGELQKNNNSSFFALLVLLLIIPAILAIMKRNTLLAYKNRFLRRKTTSSERLQAQEIEIPTICAVDIAAKSKIYSKAIVVTAFQNYVKTSVANGELERQHALFPQGQTKPWTEGSSDINKSKNRYKNLVAYDHTRVVLRKVNDEHSDYINASYIDGYKMPRAYIATQGPLQTTLYDFWRMIWQENVKHIAMLANIFENGKKKVEQYWPDINRTITFGEITVQHISSEVFADYECRIFNVTHKEMSRKIQHIHFRSWPDHGVPLYSQSLVPFLKKMLFISINSKSPVVVHCSAGVGRTGTIILADICLRMAAREGVVDPLKILQKMRTQRPNMVDNIHQYKLAHLVILECLVGMNTVIPCSEIDKNVDQLLNEGVERQMLYLQETHWQDEAMKSFGDEEEQALIVPEKNRFQHIIPEIQGRIFITRHPPNDEKSSYINAVRVDGFRSPGRYIVTQQPLPNTLGDFWRLIDENKISVIISLNEVDNRDKTSCIFWPTKNSTTINPVDSITLTYLDSTISDYCSSIKLNLKNKNTLKQIFIISPRNWVKHTLCPKDVIQFLRFWQEADSTSRQSKPVVITCYDGATASGLYIAMCFLIEKIKLEQACDVCLAVRTIRHNRPQFIVEKEQFEFLYKIAVAFIEEFQDYSNFV